MTQQRRIALVEDHALIAIGFRDLVAPEADLTLAGMVESVAALDTIEGHLDLVVLDLRLADGSLPKTMSKRFMRGVRTCSSIPVQRTAA